MNDLPPGDLLALVTENRDTDAARSLIKYFYDQMDGDEDYGRNGLEASDVALVEEYCLWAFQQIVDGKDANTAFGLKKPRGRPKKDTFERDLVTACFVESRYRSGDNFEAVLLEAVEALTISLGGVKKAYTASSYIVAQLTDDEVQEILSFQNIPKKT